MSIEMDSVDSLRIVCSALKQECTNDELLKLRKRLNRTHVENSRLRKKAQTLESDLMAERMAKQILQAVAIQLIRRMDSLRLPAASEHA